MKEYACFPDGKCIHPGPSHLLSFSCPRSNVDRNKLLGQLILSLICLQYKTSGEMGPDK